MFSFTLTRRKLFRGFCIKSAAVLFCVCALLFAGCDLDSGDEKGNLNGSWTDGYGNMEIDTAANTIIRQGEYEGEIINTPDYEAESGVIIYKFTTYWEKVYDENWNVVSSTQTDKNNGKYGAVYWANLKAGSVNMSDAYTGGTVHTMFDNEAKALEEFTLGNASSYAYLTGTPYTK